MDCQKVPYGNEGDAKEAMFRAMYLAPRHNNGASRNANVYVCPLCGKWHWGHLPTSFGPKARWNRERRRRRIAAAIAAKGE